MFLRKVNIVMYSNRQIVDDIIEFVHEKGVFEYCQLVDYAKDSAPFWMNVLTSEVEFWVLYLDSLRRYHAGA